MRATGSRCGTFQSEKLPVDQSLRKAAFGAILRQGYIAGHIRMAKQILSVLIFALLVFAPASRADQFDVFGVISMQIG